MDQILSAALHMQAQAHKILEKLTIAKIWAAHGAKINIVGSLATGLLINNKDIDLHVYSDEFTLKESFAAMADIARNKGINDIVFKNLLYTDKKCVQWHLWYTHDDTSVWEISMVHINKASPYAGYFEKITRQIAEVLTPETKLAILNIKNDTPPYVKIMAVEIYEAVLKYGIRNYKDFVEWREDHPPKGMPGWQD